MKIYVAASQFDYLRARDVMRELTLAGHTVTHDWTVEVEAALGYAPAPDDVRAAALADYKGVVNADVVLVLSPDQHDWGCALWTELGIALDRHRRIVVTGQQRNRNVFAFLCERYATDSDGIDAIIGGA